VPPRRSRLPGDASRRGDARREDARVDLQRSAEIQALLEGIRLPATRDDLVAYASALDREAGSELLQIADREYGYLDEVGEELARTRPAPLAPEPVPRAESGQPPGGVEYTNPQPESGQVRTDAPPEYPASKQIEAQSQVLKKQQAKQQS
jgi:hypothetical protein